MRIWIDMANSPHVPFFRALRTEFARRGERGGDRRARLRANDRAGGSGGAVANRDRRTCGRELAGKAGNLIGRAAALARWAHGRRFDLAVSHNSYTQIVAARVWGRVGDADGLRASAGKSPRLRVAARVIVPRAFPDAALRATGASAIKVRVRWNKRMSISRFSPTRIR